MDNQLVGGAISEFCCNERVTREYRVYKPMITRYLLRPVCNMSGTKIIQKSQWTVFDPGNKPKDLMSLNLV